MSTVLTTAPSREDTQRRHVQTALQPRKMALYLAEAFAIDLASRGEATCHILDVKYEPGEYCTILYAFNRQMVIGTLRWTDSHAELPSHTHLIAPLNMQVYRFGADPALPGMATVLDGPALAAALQQALPRLSADRVRILRCQATPLRYRPGKRCTLRIDIATRDEQGVYASETLFGKVYHDLAKATAVNREMHMLADSEPAQAGRMVVARPAAFLPELQLVVQQPINGVPLEMLLSGFEGGVTGGDPRAWDGVLRAAPALAALHTAGLATDRERPIVAEVKRFSQRASKARSVDTSIGAELTKLAEALKAGLAQLPAWGEEIGLVHGDCKPSQILMQPAGVAILDFDHCGMADQATDIGTFVATLRQQGIWQSLRAGGTLAAASRKQWLRNLEQQFLAEYCAASNRDERFVCRVTWYEAVALMRKALRSFARSPRSPMPRALVEEAWRCLAGLPAPS